MSDMLEKLTYVTDEVNTEATKAAREVEVAKSLADYRRKAKPVTSEKMAEMRVAFGEGTKVVNILTGESYSL